MIASKKATERSFILSTYCPCKKVSIGSHVHKWPVALNSLLTDRGLGLGLPVDATPLRDKSVLIKLIGFTLVTRQAPRINRKAILICLAQSKRVSWTVASSAVGQKGAFLRFLDGELGSSNGIPKVLGRAGDGA